jgi:hypothetical protein
MQWLADNWIWLVVIGGMVGMHMFGHGHGAHGKGGGGGCCGGGTDKAKEPGAANREPGAASGHQH